jgi:class 3 adenylate cyclase
MGSFRPMPLPEEPWTVPDGLVGAGEQSSPAPTAESVIDNRLWVILITDLVGSTERMAAVGDRSWRYLLNAYYTVINEELRFFGGFHVGSTGDGSIALFGVPIPAIRCAAAIREGVRVINMDIRAGLHAGECQWLGSNVTGMAVHIAARVAQEAEPGELLASGTVKELIAGYDMAFGDRGFHRLKGVPGERRLYTLLDKGQPARIDGDVGPEGLHRYPS